MVNRASKMAMFNRDTEWIMMNQWNTNGLSPSPTSWAPAANTVSVNAWAALKTRWWSVVGWPRRLVPRHAEQLENSSKSKHIKTHFYRDAQRKIEPYWIWIVVCRPISCGTLWDPMCRLRCIVHNYPLSFWFFGAWNLANGQGPSFPNHRYLAGTERILLGGFNMFQPQK